MAMARDTETQKKCREALSLKCADQARTDRAPGEPELTLAKASLAIGVNYSTVKNYLAKHRAEWSSLKLRRGRQPDPACASAQAVAALGDGPGAPLTQQEAADRFGVSQPAVSKRKKRSEA